MIGLNLRVTGHCHQGGRKYMEDAFVVAYQQTEDKTDLEYAYFGIFDGHGGREAALYAKEHLLNAIVKQSGFWSNDDERVLRAIKRGFLTTHLGMWKEVGTFYVPNQALFRYPMGQGSEMGQELAHDATLLPAKPSARGGSIVCPLCSSLVMLGAVYSIVHDIRILFYA